MSRVLIIITFAFFLMNCQTSPVGQNINEEEEVSQAKTTNQSTTCLTNNQSEECSLLLESISFSLPDLQCDPYELVVDVETGFHTPAGLGNGSTSRIDWEFLPNGNAGHWTTAIEEPVAANSSGIISMKGCFSYGDQTTLRITRTIIDEFGNESNVLDIEIPDPTPSKTVAGAQSVFEFQYSELSLN